MFSYLKSYRVILVTGPQRSGTTICARMIAYDTDYKFVREDDFANDERYLRNMVVRGQRIVVQCPAHAHIMQDFRDHDDIAVVFMVRDTNDIVASQKRINWTWEGAEKAKYGDFADGRPVCEVKLDYWRKFQKPYLPNPFEVHYVDLAEHDLWVPKDKRRAEAWHPRQIDSANVW